MTTRNKRILTTGAIFLLCLAGAHGQTQPLQVKDHPLVSRFPGSTVAEYKAVDFDEYPLAISEYPFKELHLEGKITHFRFVNPPNHSSLEILRAYQEPLLKRGFQIVFACSQVCGGDRRYVSNYMKWLGGWCVGDTVYCGEETPRYLATKLKRPAGDIYVVVRLDYGPDKKPNTYLNIIEVKPGQAGQAAALGNDVAALGHAAVYGIFFDSGKAALKPESDAAMAQISGMLAADPKLKLHVVGHTDNVGTAAANLALSRQRADAVVAALVSRYHIAADRLQAAGVGPVAPVASNRTEDGRTANRRVELVEQ